MADNGFLAKVQQASDLDLAALLCLISHEHCIISTEEDYVDHLLHQLQLVLNTQARRIINN